MAKKTKFKVGDKVRSANHIGIWELVWYKAGNNTCVIKNHHTRSLAKVSQLKLIIEDKYGME
jgi:hypothetical protein